MVCDVNCLKNISILFEQLHTLTLADLVTFKTAFVTYKAHHNELRISLQKRGMPGTATSSQ